MEGLKLAPHPGHVSNSGDRVLPRFEPAKALFSEYPNVSAVILVRPGRPGRARLELLLGRLSEYSLYLPIPHHENHEMGSVPASCCPPAGRDGIGTGRFIAWLDIAASKFYDWRERYGGERAQRLGSPGFLAKGLGEAGHHRIPPEESPGGYRRLTFMMLGRRHCGGESFHRLAGAGPPWMLSNFSCIRRLRAYVL
jgi:hypothetical protein